MGFGGWGGGVGGVEMMVGVEVMIGLVVWLRAWVVCLG